MTASKLSLWLIRLSTAAEHECRYFAPFGKWNLETKTRSFCSHELLTSIHPELLILTRKLYEVKSSLTFTLLMIKLQGYSQEYQPVSRFKLEFSQALPTSLINPYMILIKESEPWKHRQSWNKSRLVGSFYWISQQINWLTNTVYIIWANDFIYLHIQTKHWSLTWKIGV
jgi:hypothetical protein